MRYPTAQILLLLAATLSMAACSSLSSRSGTYSGTIVPYQAVRVGFAEGVTMSLTVTFHDEYQLDGVLSTSDGTFADTPLSPIPALTNDRLGTFSFDDSGLANYLYTAVVAAGPFASQEALTVITVFDETVEVRVILGNKGLYGVFKLHR